MLLFKVLNLCVVGLAVYQINGPEWTWDLLLAISIYQALVAVIMVFGYKHAPTVPARWAVNIDSITDALTGLLVASAGHVGWGVVWLGFALNAQVMRNLIAKNLSSGERGKS